MTQSKLSSSHLLGLITALMPLVASGYGPDMHDAMSVLALVKSKSVNSSVPFKDWGIDQNLDQLTLPSWSSPGQTASATDLIRKGVRDEDSGIRPINHFYDPVSGQGLVTCLRPLANQPSPDWAILGAGQRDDSNFSYAKARTSMNLGLVSSTPADRDKYLGQMFESLGHVIHHLQDMAQPQHVRNDAHQEMPGILQYLPFPFNNSSRYEAYSEGRTDLVSGTYQLVRLPAPSAPSDYWSSDQGIVGMAKFTNWNFVSQGSNFRLIDGLIAPNARYGHPVMSDVDPRDIKDLLRAEFGCPIPDELNPNPPSSDQRCSLAGEVDFVVTDVTDNLTNEQGTQNRRAAMFSIFNQDLQRRFINFSQEDSCGGTLTVGGKLFTVNALTFPEALSLLAPRAAGYSAGMIDYLFRGSIDFASNPQTSKYEFTNSGDEPLSGTVTLYYDATDGNRYPVRNGAWTVQDLLPHQSVVPDPFEPPVDPPPATKNKYLMVFSGTMGAEGPLADGPGAIIGKMVDVPFPELYWSWNFFTHQDGSGSSLPPGNYSSAQMTFTLPAKMDTPFTQNFATAHVKINGQDLPALGYGTDRCVSGGPLFYGVAHAVQTDPIQWEATYNPVNSVLYEDGATGNTFFSDANHFMQYRGLTPNVFPSCSTHISLLFINGDSNVSIEYLLGTSSIFKFCVRLDPNAINSYDLHPTAVVSHLQGIRVTDGAIDIRVESPAVKSCPGY